MRDEIIYSCTNNACTEPLYTGRCKKECWDRYLGIKNKKSPEEVAEWVDASVPGQITCGGNPVYACGKCGKIYGSHELIPSAKYCSECGVRLILPRIPKKLPRWEE